VTALFPAKAISFSLPEGATLADLANSFETISDHDTHMPMAIYLTFGVTSQPVSNLRSGL
jgi:hypothetical protein